MRDADRGALVAPGIRYMAGGALFFSIMSLLVKFAGQRLPSQEIVLVRAAIMVVLSYATLRAAGVFPWGERRGLLLARGLIGFLALSCFYYAVVHLPLADATLIQYTNPVFAALLAAWLLSERMGWREVLCVAGSLAGVTIAARPSFLFGGAAVALPPFAVGVALAGAVFSGGAYVLVRKLGQSEHPSVIVFYFSLVAMAGSVPATAMNAVWPTPLEWLVLLGVGVTTQIGQVLMTRGLRLEPAGRATAVGYLQIVFAAVWGAIFFAEYPGIWSFAGALLIVGSTLALALTRSATAAAPRTP